MLSCSYTLFHYAADNDNAAAAAAAPVIHSTSVFNLPGTCWLRCSVHLQPRRHPFFSLILCVRLFVCFVCLYVCRGYACARVIALARRRYCALRACVSCVAACGARQRRHMVRTPRNRVWLHRRRLQWQQQQQQQQQQQRQRSDVSRLLYAADGVAVGCTVRDAACTEHRDSKKVQFSKLCQVQ